MRWEGFIVDSNTIPTYLSGLLTFPVSSPAHTSTDNRHPCSFTYVIRLWNRAEVPGSLVLFVCTLPFVLCLGPCLVSVSPIHRWTRRRNYICRCAWRWATVVDRRGAAYGCDWRFNRLGLTPMQPFNFACVCSTCTSTWRRILSWSIGGACSTAYSWKER